MSGIEILDSRFGEACITVTIRTRRADGIRLCHDTDRCEITSLTGVTKPGRKRRVVANESVGIPSAREPHGTQEVMRAKFDRFSRLRRHAATLARLTSDVKKGAGGLVQVGLSVA